MPSEGKIYKLSYGISGFMKTTDGGLASEGDLQEIARKEGEARPGPLKAFPEEAAKDLCPGPQGLGEVGQMERCWD